MLGRKGQKVYVRVWTKDGGEETVVGRKQGKLIKTKDYGHFLTSPDRTRHGRKGKEKGKPVVYVQEGSGEASDTDWLGAYHGTVEVNGAGKVAPAAVKVSELPTPIVTSGEVDEISSNQYVSDVLYGMRRSAMDKASQWIMILLQALTLAALIYFFNETSNAIEELTLRLGFGPGAGG